MVEYLEELLCQKAKKEHCFILYHQWRNDRVKLEKYLQSISYVFPHYTEHGASHSEAILSNVVKILGKKSFKHHWGANDIWLLLSAAYWHDAGMVITEDKFDRLFEDEKENADFLRHVEETLQESGNNLSRSFTIQQTSGGNKKIYFRPAILTQDSLFAQIELFASYFRKKHPEQSQQLIQEQYDLTKGPQPSELVHEVPRRLFFVLGDICAAHGWDFQRVMSELPFETTGVGDGCTAHPRLIACLLRIGDLLDMDNNRMDMTRLACIGLEALPKDTMRHLQKHLAISHLLLTPDKISISASLKGLESGSENDSDLYNVAEVINSWFGWIEDEFKQQLSCWKSAIAPPKYHITLPNLDLPFRIEMANGYEYLTEKSKPVFTMNTKQAFELIQGFNLYSNPLVALREVIQNSIDSSLIKFWYTMRRQQINDTQWWNRYIRLKQNPEYAIRVEILPLDGKYRISVCDTAMGLQKEDLRYLLQVGSGKRNRRKAEWIAQMPEWLRPSGAFGIGFQSLFMLTDQVRMETRSLLSGESYEVIFFSPLGTRTGDVLIRKNTDVHQTFGISYTNITFEVEQQQLQRMITANPVRIQPQSHRTVCEELILQQIRQSMAASPLMLKVVFWQRGGKQKKETIPIAGGGQAEPFDSSKYEVDLQLEDKQEKVWVQLKFEKAPKERIFSGRTKVYFKNQYVCDFSQAVRGPISFPYVDISLNILSGDASEWLCLNRSEFLSERRPQVGHIVRRAWEDYYLFPNRALDPELQLVYDAFIADPTKDSKTRYTDIDLQPYVKGYCPYPNVPIILKACSFSDLMDAKSLVLIGNEQARHEGSIEWKPSDDGQLKLYEQGQPELYNLKLMLLILWKRAHPGESFQYYISDEKGLSFQVKIPEQSSGGESSSPSECLHVVGEMNAERPKYFGKGDLVLWPCPEKFQNLAVKTNELPFTVGSFLPFDQDAICDNLMVVSVGNEPLSDELITLLYEYHRDKDVTLQSFRALYREWSQQGPGKGNDRV